MKYITSLHLFKYKPLHFSHISYNNFQAHVSQIQEWTQINAHGHSKVICLICKSKVFHVVLNSPLNLTTLRSLILFCFWVKFFEIRLSKLRHSQILNYKMSIGLKTIVHKNNFMIIWGIITETMSLRRLDVILKNKYLFSNQ